MTFGGRMHAVAGALLVALSAPSGAGAQGTEGPSLVVMISVDQLRADLMDRYAHLFDGGLARLLHEGHRYTQASHNHAVTETAAGHATLSTGVYPARSGIVANSWEQRSGEAWVSMYAVADSTSPILGLEELPTEYGRSPRNLLRGGLADWVAAADDDARVVSLSGKDRAAITMAGTVPGHVYWLFPGAGRFVTSTHYRDHYPEWLERFNQEVMPGILADTVWSHSAPETHRDAARADSADYEADGVHTTFPHRASAETRVGNPAARNAWVLTKPGADRAVAALAKEAIDILELARRGSVDYLSLSFSATDYVGHGYGPLSQEQLDNLVRLDGELGALFRHLDEAVGAGRWVAGFAADHGVMTMPEYLAEQGKDGVRIDGEARSNAIFDELRAAVDMAEDMPDMVQRFVRGVEKKKLVAAAYPHSELTADGEPADSFAVLFRHSHHPDRAAGLTSRYGIELRFGEYHLFTSYPTGTTHGSPYWYDRHVPFILMGAGVRPGISHEPVCTVDLAPTLAALARIPVPDDLDGSVVYR